MLKINISLSWVRVSSASKSKWLISLILIIFFCISDTSNDFFLSHRYFLIFLKLVKINKFWNLWVNQVEKIVIFSDMVVFSSYAMQVVMSFMMLTMIFIILPRASVSAKRIMEVLDTKTRIADGKVDKASEGVIEIRYENVSFRYPGAEKDTLHDKTLTRSSPTRVRDPSTRRGRGPARRPSSRDNTSGTPARRRADGTPPRSPRCRSS